MFIEYNGISYTIPKDIYEPYNIYFQRLWFIAKQEPGSEEQLKECIRYSLIWKNIKFLGCKYSDKIHNKIGEIEGKVIIYR